MVARGSFPPQSGVGSDHRIGEGLLVIDAAGPVVDTLIARAEAGGE